MAPSAESSLDPSARVVVVTISIAMGMEAAHNIADYLGRLFERGGGIEPQPRHAEENAAMDRLQPVAGIRQGALGDGGERIGEIALGQRLAELFGTDVVNGYGCASHGRFLARFYK